MQDHNETSNAVGFQPGEIITPDEEASPLVRKWLGGGLFKVIRTGAPRVDNLCDCGESERKDGLHRLDCRYMRPQRWWVIVQFGERLLRLAADFFRRVKP